METNLHYRPPHDTVTNYYFKPTDSNPYPYIQFPLDVPLFYTLVYYYVSKLSSFFTLDAIYVALLNPPVCDNDL